MTNVKNEYYVYARDTGGCYICERVARVKTGKYFWSKNKKNATPLTYDAARKVVNRYGGEVRKF